MRVLIVWAHWSEAVERMRRSGAAVRRLAYICARCIVHGRRAAAWRRWQHRIAQQREAEVEQEQERQIERLRSSIHDRHRTRGACAMVRCASRLCHTRYASAWTSWCDAVDAKAKGGRLLRGCIGRLTQGRKGSAWRRWVQHVEGGRQEELVREWQGRLEAVGLRYERERAAHASSRLASCLRRLRSRWCAQAWGEWCSAAGVSEYVRRLSLIHI